jgi:prepilin-type N-terminal cleavage/methylation domain-containing protein
MFWHLRVQPLETQLPQAVRVKSDAFESNALFLNVTKPERIFQSNGFTLIETVIATAILVTASVAIASLFAFSARSNLTNGERTVAALLVSDKLEQLKVVPLSAVGWSVGGGLNPASPVPDFSDYVQPANESAPYLRLWQITGNRARTVTVAVFARAHGRSGLAPIELVRATTTVSPPW